LHIPKRHELKILNHIHLKKKLLHFFVAFFCHFLFLYFLAPLLCFFFAAAVASVSCSVRSFIEESVKMRDFTFFLCLLSHLGPGFWMARTSSGERLSLLFPEISYPTAVLAEGTEISWLRSSLAVGATNDGSKSSSLKASLEKGHTPGLPKTAVIFFTVKDA
jgi:hypothetical protein